jgi:hypothetical protein
MQRITDNVLISESPVEVQPSKYFDDEVGHPVIELRGNYTARLKDTARNNAVAA